MSSKIKREQLLHALELVSPGLSTKDVADQTNSYCFENGQVFTFDEETACIMPSPLKIKGSVPGEPLRNILSKLKEEYLEFTQEDGKLKIKGKGQWVTILMENKIELSINTLEIPKKWKRLPEQFSEALKLVSNCAGRDDQHFELTCVHLSQDWIEAYDQLQLARFTIQLGLKKSTLVRQVSIRHLINLEMNEIGETKNWLHFRNSAGLIFACRRFNEDFIDVSSAAAVSGKKIQLPKGIIETTENAEVFSVKNEQNSHILITLKPGWVFVKGEGRYGYYKGRRKISYKGEELCFMIHPEILKKIVTQHNECEICVGNFKALKAQLGAFLYVTSLAEPPGEIAAVDHTTNGSPVKKKKKVKV